MPFRSALVFLAVCAADLAAEVHVTGAALTVRDQTTIPDGLWGVHAANPAAAVEWGARAVRRIHHQVPGRPGVPGRDLPAELAQVVECFYDRYQPALQLREPETWQTQLEDRSRRFAAEAKAVYEQTGFMTVVEFWNEPYLNWSTKPGVNHDPRWYETEGVQAGDRVTIRGAGEPTEYLVWREATWFEDEGAAAHDVTNAWVALGNRGYQWHRTPVGEVMEHGRHRLRKITTLVPEDPTKPSWWSGKQNALWYNEMFGIAAAALKDGFPDLPLVAGWGFHLHQGDWVSWDDLWVPLFAQYHQLMDGFHEHHYGTDTLDVAASYRTAWHHVFAAHGSDLDGYNTEAGSNYDPQRPDRYKNMLDTYFESVEPNEQLRRSRIQLAYLLRDIVGMIDHVPDIAAARAAHHPQYEYGTRLGFGLLRPLTGRLLQVERPDSLLVAASRTGDQLVLVVVNRLGEAQRVPLRISVAVAGGALRRAVLVPHEQQPERMVLRLDERALDAPPKQLDLAPYEGQVLVLDLEDDAPLPVMQRDILPIGPVLEHVTPEQPMTRTIELPEGGLDAASALRLVLVSPEDANQAGLRWAVADRDPMPVAAAGPRRELVLDPAWLAGSASLTLRLESDAPWRLWSAQLEIERPVD